MATPVRIESDVVIVGSGMGGATTAYALANKGVKTLVLERGERMPREPENWSPSEIFMKTRYKPNEKWVDENDKEFVPGVHYFVGGNSKVYGASLPRFSRFDFGIVKHQEGTSPAWPFTYEDLEPYYYDAEELYRVHGDAQNIYGNDRSTPFPYPAMQHEPYVEELGARLREAGVHPHSNSMGIDLGPGGKCIRCKTCDGFVCKLDAKSDAEVNALNPAIATGKVTLMTSVQVNRIVLSQDGKTVSHL
jgi:choline dehydrogenase-like flavoprotein